MISYDEALAAIAALTLPASSEKVPLSQSAGHISAAEVCLDRDQPGFDRATMDGYAVIPDGSSTSFRVIGARHAGETDSLQLAAGDALRIMTGAIAPPGCAVVPIECTDGGRQHVQIPDGASLQPGANVARQGEDGRAGELAVPRGTFISPLVQSVLAMAGCERPEVYRAPRLGLCTTGDEVGGGGEAGIRDSNGPFLMGLAAALQLPLARQHAGDSTASLHHSLQELQASADIVLTTGGVSMGERDLLPSMLQELGYSIIFHQVAVQPGKPVLLAQHPDDGLALCLPGNPVSVCVTAHLFLLPLLQRFWPGWRPPTWHLPLAKDFQQRKPRRLFLPAQLQEDGCLHPVAWNGSGDLLAAACADGLVDLGADCSHASGDLRPFIPYVNAGGSRAVLSRR